MRNAFSLAAQVKRRTTFTASNIDTCSRARFLLSCICRTASTKYTTSWNSIIVVFHFTGTLLSVHNDAVEKPHSAPRRAHRRRRIFSARRSSRDEIGEFGLFNVPPRLFVLVSRLGRSAGLPGGFSPPHSTGIAIMRRLLGVVSQVIQIPLPVYLGSSA